MVLYFLFFSSSGSVFPLLLFFPRSGSVFPLLLFIFFFSDFLAQKSIHVRPNPLLPLPISSPASSTRERSSLPSSRRRPAVRCLCRCLRRTICSSSSRDAAVGILKLSLPIPLPNPPPVHLGQSRRPPGLWLLRIALTLIRPSTVSGTPSEIRDNPKFYPYFQKCIGAIDGTHVAATAPAQSQTTYRGRKSTVTQNVMVACSFDMMFTFVYTGWEGTANDSRVFMDALIRTDNQFPFPSEGYYYVVDSGYMNMLGFLSLYRGQRYHLRDYRGSNRGPRGAVELFNYRHSSLRNVIERSFGVLKARFAILKLMPNYPTRRQRLIPSACCALHNFIRREARRDRMFQEFEVNDMIFEDDMEDIPQVTVDLSQAQIAAMNQTRDSIAERLWADYTRNM